MLLSPRLLNLLYLWISTSQSSLVRKPEVRSQHSSAAELSLLHPPDTGLTQAGVCLGGCDSHGNSGGLICDPVVRFQGLLRRACGRHQMP
ncbi:hypothetical protein V1520DRAFT_314898 [Lipomyces starkeyi]|uniref:Hydrophobin n=1 Tax=Lipomyces starkeyi NRRL Y-11557 TaxID=675824 RepID=A0A1E3Q2F0_LIPST|nr:hypothetical protein LIPSTDRAFT_331483 [Lipomyces starkeyi NRRL Y-11557]